MTGRKTFQTDGCSYAKFRVVCGHLRSRAFFSTKTFCENYSGVAGARREPRTLFSRSYRASMFADREWNRIRELLGLLCSSLESTSWGLASIVQRCQQKFREMRGFFPTRESASLELTQKCQRGYRKSGWKTRGALPLKDGAEIYNSGKARDPKKGI